jgi:hypothetical protein
MGLHGRCTLSGRGSQPGPAVARCFGAVAVVFFPLFSFFFSFFFLQGAPDADVPDFLAGGANLRAKQVWERPEVPTALASASEEFMFQTMEMDYTHGQPVSGMPGNQVGFQLVFLRLFSHCFLQVGPVPILRVYGVTEAGNSVLCNVHGFLPYLWIPAPMEFKVKSFDFDFFKIINFFCG